MFAIQQLTSSVEIGKRILGQYLYVCTAFPKDKREDVGRVVMEVLQKIDSVRTNRQHLQDIITKELAVWVSPESIGDDVENRNRASGAETAFENVLLQSKSTLDILAKVMRPLCELKNIETFGKAGVNLTKALRNNLPDSQKAKGEIFAVWLEACHPWLSSWISDRDDAAHRRPIHSLGFRRRKLAEHIVFITEPTYEGTSFDVFACDLMLKLIDFCDDFLVHGYNVSLPDGIALVPSGDAGDFLKPRYVYG